MTRTITRALLIPLSLLAQALLAPPLPAQSTVHGIVTEQNSGNRPIANVQIKALGSTPELSDNNGAFVLVFPAKKPGERIVVTEVSKQGYEIVNRDVLASWLVPADPRNRLKIVMCPEGALAQNILRYYDISLGALTRGYNEELQRLRVERDHARIDARAFEERATSLAERFSSQQRQLEDLAERFARENFDDCSAVHRHAFAAFSAGNVEEAIRVLESVNSEEVIARAKLQLEKGERLEAEARTMTAESREVIRQNIDKLLFQATLYFTSGRYGDAARTFESAASSDTAYFPGVYRCAVFFRYQHDAGRARRWASAAGGAARSEYERGLATEELAAVEYSVNRFEAAESLLREALDVFRRLAEADPRSMRADLAREYKNIASIQWGMRKYREAEANARQALALRRSLMGTDTAAHGSGLARALNLLGMILADMGQRAQAAERFREAIALHRAAGAAGPVDRAALADALNNLASLQQAQKEYAPAEANYAESLAMFRELAAANPDVYREQYARTLGNLAQLELAVKRMERVESRLQEVVATYEELASKNPQVHAPSLAASLASLGAYYDAQRDYGRSERACAAGVAIYRDLAAANPAVFAPHLMAALRGLGSAYWHDGKRDSADARNAECLALARSLAASDTARYLQALATVLMDLGWEQRTDRLPQAIEYTTEAFGLYKTLLGMKAKVASYLTVCCRRMARYMILARRFPDAEIWARDEGRYGSDSRKPRKNLAHAYLYQGRYDEARAIYAELKNEIWSGSETYRDVFLEDLNEFEKAGVTTPDVARIRDLLR